MSTKKGRLGPRRHRDKSKRALVLGHAVVEADPARLDLRVPVQIQADAAAPRAVRQREAKADAAVRHVDRRLDDAPFELVRLNHIR